MSEPDFHFTFHFSNFQYPLSQDTGLGNLSCFLFFWLLLHLSLLRWIGEKGWHLCSHRYLLWNNAIFIMATSHWPLASMIMIVILKVGGSLTSLTLDRLHHLDRLETKLVDVWKSKYRKPDSVRNPHMPNKFEKLKRYTFFFSAMSLPKTAPSSFRFLNKIVPLQKCFMNDLWVLS